MDVRDACPGCRSPQRVTLYRRPYSDPEIRQYLHDFYSPQGGVEYEYLEGADYVLDECSDCGLIYQEQIPGPELMLRLYETWLDPKRSFETYRSSRSVASFAATAQEIARVHAYLGAAPFELEVLDFGMGWGNWCFLAKGFGCTAHGTELSAARIELARASGIEVVRWEEIPGQRYDLIHTEQVFEHLAEPLATLRHLARGLRPGGLVRLSVPDGGDIKERLKHPDWRAPKGSPTSLNAVAPLEHVNCFHREALVRMAGEAGLELVESLSVSRRQRWQERGKKAVRLLLRSLTSRHPVGIHHYFRRPPAESA